MRQRTNQHKHRSIHKYKWKSTTNEHQHRNIHNTTKHNQKANDIRNATTQQHKQQQKGNRQQINRNKRNIHNIQTTKQTTNQHTNLIIEQQAQDIYNKSTQQQRQSQTNTNKHAYNKSTQAPKQTPKLIIVQQIITNTESDQHKQTKDINN